MPEFDVQRLPELVQYKEIAKFTETYGFAGSQGMVNLEGQRLIPKGRDSKTLLLFMHPSTTLNLLPMPNAIAKAGQHVLCAASRYPKNDSALIMEKVILDMGAWVRAAKEDWGYEKVVLCGWSGGGSLSMFYQAEALNPTIEDTPAGDPVDVKGANMIPADACIFQAAHMSRAKTMTDWMDPSVKDELNPDDRIVELDLYDPKNPNQPPYDRDYIARFREAQVARNRKITAWVREKLDELKKKGGAEVERAFIVHRTMAEPRWLDPTLDPNGRKPGWCFLGNPETVNSGPVGLGRFTTLRAWLSQWSYDESRADGPTSAARIKGTPLLFIENEADDAVPQPHTPHMYEVAGSEDKEYVSIEGATHYYLGQPEKLAEAQRVMLDWLAKRNLVEL